MEKRIEKIIKGIRDVVGKDKVVLGVSGGIDSLVLAILLNEAISSNLHGLFLDSSLNRLGDKETIKEYLSHYNIKLKIISIEKEILGKLKNKKYAADKKEVIKKVFINAFNSYAKKIKAKFIANGTNKNDSEILFRKNRGLVLGTNIKNLEPFINLTKSQIKSIGKMLKLPKDLVDKKPLSSWGMSRRTIGINDGKKLKLTLKADRIFIDRLKAAGIYGQFKNIAAYLYPYFDTKSHKDDFFVILKVISKVNKSVILPAKMLKDISSAITSGIPEITRVVYDVTESSFITKEWD